MGGKWVLEVPLGYLKAFFLLPFSFLFVVEFIYPLIFSVIRTSQIPFQVLDLTFDF